MVEQEMHSSALKKLGLELVMRRLIAFFYIQVLENICCRKILIVHFEKILSEHIWVLILITNQCLYFTGAKSGSATKQIIRLLSPRTSESLIPV